MRALAAAALCSLLFVPTSASQSVRPSSARTGFIVGQIVADAWVAVFATHPGAWFHNSRRVAAVKTSADGRYAIRNLPAGEYHLATVFDLEQGEWFDAVLLRQLATAALRIPITDNEQKAVDPVFR
jgi:hypothetical protein